MAFPDLPSILAGDRPTGDDWVLLFAAIQGLAPVFARKTADEIVNNSAVMQNDNHLFGTVSANAQYRVSLRLRVTTGVTPDFKFQFTLPAAASGFYTVLGIGAGAAALALFDDSMVLPQTIEGGSASQVLAEGLIVVGANAGVVQLQWAQNVANVSDTTVFTESYLELRRVA